MACICRCSNQFLRFWSGTLEDAYTLAEHSTCLTRVTPQKTSSDWHKWNVQELNPAQCRIAASHASSDIFWEKFKIAALAVGGIALTALLTATIAVVAGIILEFTAEIFLGLAILGFEILGESLLFAAVLCVGGGFVGTFEFASFMCWIAFLVGKIWTREFLPAIYEVNAYATDLESSMQQLNNKAEGA